ncbi:GNAT family N-acetyltransferase [Candidatus Microgenomates bacterium]|nr:GNAT family N-acetyltransferase [Candidatus Microgenomates bacterium]
MKNGDSYLERLISETQGKHLPMNFVPQTTYWLVEGDEFIGRVTVRHILNKLLEKEGGHIGFDIRPSKRRKGYGMKILQLAIPKAKEWDLEKALLICNDNNEAAIKIIKANGGVLQDRIKQGHGLPQKLRFWIQLKPPEDYS